MVNLSYQKTDIPKSFKTKITLVDSGSKHTCAIKGITPTSHFPDAFQLGCWGVNTYGQTDTPSSFQNASIAALGDYHTCAISPRMLACWGNNQFGQTTVPKGFRKAQQVKTHNHTCAIAHLQGKSQVGCWGQDSDGQTNVPQSIYDGNNINDFKVSAEDKIQNSNEGVYKEIVALSVGNDTSVGVDMSGELHIWGKMKNTSIPEKQKYDVHDVNVCVMLCVLRKDTTIKCFGKYNEY